MFGNEGKKLKLILKMENEPEKLEVEPEMKRCLSCGIWCPVEELSNNQECLMCINNEQ